MKSDIKNVPHEDGENGLYIESTDYASFSSERSIWGDVREGIASLISQLPKAERLLDLASGDGRYLQSLLDRADLVVALDADANALQSAIKKTDIIARRIVPVVHNAIQPLPFLDSYFSAILCTGFLHYHDHLTLKVVFDELRRVLSNGGTLIFDFSTDVRRESADSSLVELRRGYEYSCEEAKAAIASSLPGWVITMSETKIEKKPMKIQGRDFIWSSIDLHVKAVKDCR